MCPTRRRGRIDGVAAAAESSGRVLERRPDQLPGAARAEVARAPHHDANGATHRKTNKQDAKFSTASSACRS